MEGLINKMKNIHRDPSLSPRGSAPGTAKKTSSKSHIPGGLLPGHGRMRSGPPSPHGGAASSLLLNKRFTLPFLALLAVLTAGLLFLLPGGLLHAQEGMTELEYAENGMDPVATFTAVDPEGRTVYWSLPTTEPSPVPDGFEATDFTNSNAPHFSISMDGVLNFKYLPNFESPMGGGTDGTGTSNSYSIVVASSDDAPGATTDGMVPGTDNLPNMAYHKVTVTVTDVDEDGSISLSALQPQEDVPLTATLTDPNSRSVEAMPITNTEWMWEQSPAMDGPWTLIPGAGAGDTDATDAVKASDDYMPAADTADMYLRVTVTYTDKHGDDKTAMEVSAHMVRAVPAGGNAAPKFPDANDDDDADDQTRTVKENSPTGTNVGKPVTAGDAGDVLTYTMSATGDNAGLYVIDRATGQIMVGPRTTLNREDPDNSDFEHVVTVRATDPYGDPNVDNANDDNSEEVTVTITVDNVNEAPRMTQGPTRYSKDENEDADDNADGVQPELSYSVMDVDADDAIEWSLMGDDKDAFDITSGDTTGTTFTADLMLKETPNYEKPTDADMDNMYMVTVVATDAKKLTAMRDVVITVKNVDDPGKITFSSVQPKVGIPFMATLTDPDGVVMESVKWQWYNDNPDSNDDGDVDDGDTNLPIAKAKSDTYTPKTADLDADGTESGTEAVSLYVRATYTDSKGSTSAVGMADNRVVVNQENQPPEFKLDDKVITATTRMVAENTDADSEDDTSDTNDLADDIMAPGDDRTKDPVMATDMSGTTPDTLTYTLGGKDAAMFRVRGDTGQIEVGADTELDYETKKSYMVTVTATDPSLLSATIDVTINVTDVNEPPDIAGEDDLTKEFRENSTSTIETFRATDPEKRPVYWSLKEGDTDYPDDAFFDISTSGALSFKEGRDFEAAADDGDDNTYKVVVVASDDAPNIGETTYTEAALQSERKFTVKVTNAIEQEQITVSPRFVEVGDSLDASLTPGDAVTEDLAQAVWTWSGAVEGTSTGATASITAPATQGTITINVTYRALGKDRKKPASVPVRAAPEPNQDPTFPIATSADVNENRPAGTLVGTFAASDPNSEHIGRLVYTLSDNANFSINNNGRVTTKVMFDHETDSSLPLVITATDPTGGAGTLTITVTINDLDEAPMIATGPTRALDWPETKAIATPVAVYTADADPEGNTLVWSLTGTDATDFYIGNQENGTLGHLTFKEMPDYEKPAAANNLYRVTVEVSDGKLKATRPMTVMVTDVEEEGKVTLSSVQPKAAIELTASLKDSDGDTKNIEWQWERDGDTPPNTACSDVTADDWVEIDGAESATYTPVTSPVTDVGKCLRAIAKYTDRRGDGKTSTMGVSDNPVIINTDNRAPEFKDPPSSLEIDENSDAGTAVGNIQATDPNGDTLTYSLTGDAALFKITSEDDDQTTGEDEDEHGQITVKTADTLDYEDRKTYMVTVTAADPNGEMASVDVTIKVEDVDEAPKIIVGGLVVTGTGDINYAENGMGMVAAYSAAGPDAADATWSLSGADAEDLSISSAGVLTFMASPNYEMPMDANTDNIYLVMVNANDGTNDAMKSVSVRVTNEEDPGRVTFWRDGADATAEAIVVGDMLTGLAEDPDGNVGDTPPITGENNDMYPNITGATWQWAKSMDMSTWMDIAGATNAAYTVMDDDDGYYLRATAMYSDGEGMGKMASEETMMVTAIMEQMGAVTLWDGTDALTMAPQVGDTITGLVEDPDGGVTGETWQWSRTMTPDMMDSWMDIQDATEAAYMVTADDTGYHLRVMATYMDAVGTDTAMAYSPVTMMVTAEAGDSLMDRYDTSPRDGQLSLEEVFDGIDEYFDQTGPITLQEVNDLVDLYFDQS